MINKILGVILLIMVALGGFFAFYLKEQPTPQLPATQVTERMDTLRIGILGESRSDGSEDLSYNQVVLAKLFKALNSQDVRAIFFTGNMTLGWSKSSKEIAQKDQSSQDMFGNNWAERGFVYDPVVFRQQLSQFHGFVKDSFSHPVAFYPMMGNHEAIGADAAHIVQNEFKVKNNIPSTADLLGYTVSIGEAFFAVIPTNYYDKSTAQAVEHSVTSDTLIWLKKVLEQARESHRFLFVLGHEPAFSTPSIFNKSFGLDNHPQERNAFWEVLKENGVLAYFASHEHVYDRSNRDGIWQIVSGGGGSPLNEAGNSDNAFFHCLLLTLPHQKNGVPSVSVLDADGQIRDYFELNQEKQPLYQFRIS